MARAEGADTTGNAGDGAFGGEAQTPRQPGQAGTVHLTGGLRENPDAENDDSENDEWIKEQAEARRAEKETKRSEAKAPARKTPAKKGKKK